MDRIDRDAELKKLERLARWMDARFGVRGTPFQFGLDSILGLIPGLGDLVTVAPGVYLIHRAHALGAPNSALARMTFNVVIDATFGAIPVIGDIFDVFFKANARNVGILRRHIERTHPAPETIEATARPVG